MKRLLLILAAAGLALPSCDKEKSSGPGGGSGTSGGTSGATSTRSEKTALEEFKADAIKIKQWQDTNKPDASDPMGGMAMIGQAAEKMKAVRTDGLPADLKDAYSKFLTAIGKMQDVIKDFPKDQAGFMKFMTEKAQADPEFGTKFQQKMETIGKEVETAGNHLKETGKKYGIDLDMSPDKK